MRAPAGGEWPDAGPKLLAHARCGA